MGPEELVKWIGLGLGLTGGGAAAVVKLRSKRHHSSISSESLPPDTVSERSLSVRLSLLAERMARLETRFEGFEKRADLRDAQSVREQDELYARIKEIGDNLERKVDRLFDLIYERRSTPRDRERETGT